MAQTYVTQLLVLLEGLFATIVIARALGPAGRGLYAVALTIGILGAQFGNLGLHGSNTYYLADDKTLLAQILSNTLFASLGIGTTIAVSMWVIFRLLPHYNLVHGPLLILGLISIPIGIACLLLQDLLLALQKVTEYNTADILNRSLALALIGGILFLHRVAPITMLGATVSGQAAAAVFSYSRLARHISKLPMPNLQLLRKHLKVGLNVYVTSFLGLIAIRVDLLLVKQLLGTVQAGYYSIAASFADYVLVLPTVAGLILYPKLVAVPGEADRLQQMKKAAVGIALALAVLLVITGFLAKTLVLLIFGPAYMPSVSAFLWLLPGILALGVEIVAVKFPNSFGFPPILIWVWVVSSFLNVGLNLLIIPYLGIKGASLVSSISYTFALLAVLSVIRFRWYKT